MRICLIIAVVMCFEVHSYAQDSINMIKILNIEQESIVALENRIASSIKINNPEIASMKGLRQYHIFWLGTCKKMTKEDYLDRSFLYQLTCGYFDLSPKVKKIKAGRPSLLYCISPDLYYKIKSRKWKKYLKTETLITDSVGNLVATGDARFIGFNYHTFAQVKIKLVKMFFNKEIDFVFYMGGRLGKYFCIKGNNLYSLEYTQENLKAVTWDEFMECCFDEWINPQKTKKE